MRLKMHDAPPAGNQGYSPADVSGIDMTLNRFVNPRQTIGRKSGILGLRSRNRSGGEDSGKESEKE